MTGELAVPLSTETKPGLVVYGFDNESKMVEFFGDPFCYIEADGTRTTPPREERLDPFTNRVEVSERVLADESSLERIRRDPTILDTIMVAAGIDQNVR